VRYHEV